jgi:hypothetical protein
MFLTPDSQSLVSTESFSVSFWWQGFSNRNKALVKKCVGKKFARNRAEHCTYDALLKMYKRVFEAFVESGNAIKLEEAEHVDKNGNRVEDETKAFSSMSRS